MEYWSSGVMGKGIRLVTLSFRLHPYGSSPLPCGLERSVDDLMQLFAPSLVIVFGGVEHEIADAFLRHVIRRQVIFGDIHTQ